MVRALPAPPREFSREYSSALAGLYRRRRFGMRPGLEVIRALLGKLGHPEGGFEAVHVAGSKGKGSVSALLAGVLTASHAPAGLYTSPHLQSYRERIRVGAEMITPEEVAEGLAEVEAASRGLGHSREATFFEVTTALGFWHFARRGVREAAVEVGLGGEFDATNVLRAPVAVLSTIELEHTDILGPTLTDVARAKAGILHEGMHAVCGETKPEPLGEIARRADHLGVPLWRLGREVELADRQLEKDGQTLTVRTPHREHAGLRLPLLGAFQARNAALAVAALDLFSAQTGRAISSQAVAAGFAKVHWRGRLERLPLRPPVWLDVAHTPESARALAESLSEIDPLLDPAKNVLLFGCLEGKRAEAILEALSELARTVVLVPLRSERSARAADLKRSAFGRFPRIVIAPAAPAGLSLARAATGPGGFTLVTGSDYLVGEVLDVVEGPAALEPDLSDPASAPPVSPALPAGRSRTP